MHSVILAIISTLLILIGLVGTILPFVPGVFVAWLGLFIFALGTGFERISIATTIIFLVVMLLMSAFDILVPALMARSFRAASWRASGGSIGSYVGRLTLGSRGMIFGPFLGTLIGHLIDNWKHGQYVKIAFGVLFGLIVELILKIIVVLVMLGLLIASWF
jgi:uncharacterized protein YqgC (DUF456 family)